MLNLKHMNCIYRISSERLEYNSEQDILEKILSHLTWYFNRKYFRGFFSLIHTSIFILHSWQAIYLQPTFPFSKSTTETENSEATVRSETVLT